MLLSYPMRHHSIMPRAVKSDSRARGTGGNQTPHTRSSVLSPTPRATRSSSRVALPPTSTSAHNASHTPRPPTRRSKRRTRKRGPGGAHSPRKPVAGPTPPSFTHNHGAGASINHTRRTVKKPRLEDFDSPSDHEDSDEDDGAPLEGQIEEDDFALEHAHEMGALTMLIHVLSHLKLAPDVSESSQDTPNHSPSLNDDSLTLETDDQSLPSAQNEPRNQTRHYGLLGERATSPFDEDMWKDWILTPLEFRHSQAPREPEYDGFPGPGPLPSIPCAVRFDIVMRYPATSLCMIGCARSDISNGWVVTHSKSLIIDIDEGREFINSIRYRANVTELLGEEREDALRLEYHYQTCFENTIFEHPWLLDLQKRYRLTYSLKSTLSEYQDGESLPRGTLTRNGSWNHRIQGELNEHAGFIRRTELHEHYEPRHEGLERDVGKEEGKEDKDEVKPRQEHDEEYQDKQALQPINTSPSHLAPLDENAAQDNHWAHSPPRSLFFITTPLSPIDDECELVNVTAAKQIDGYHDALDRVSEATIDALYEDLDHITEKAVNSPLPSLLMAHGSSRSSRSQTPELAYPQDGPESPEELILLKSRRITIQGPLPPPIFPFILPPSVIRPGEAFIELRTDQPDMWGYNDADSTLVRIQSAPIEPTQFAPLYSIDPPPHHPIWNDALGRIERIRTMKLYDGDPWSFSSHICENEFLDLNCDAGNDWLEDGDTIIGSGVAELCARMRAEFIHPSTLQLFTDDEVRKGLNRRLQQAYFDFELPDRPHCILDSTLSLDSIPEFDTERDPQLRAGATLHTPPGNFFAEDSFFRTAYKDVGQSRYPQTRNNIWRYDILRLRRLRLRTTQLLQHITDYLLRGSFRNHIDALPTENPVRHFFYHHCSIFRFLNPDIPVISQGFNQRCIHSLNDPHEPIYEEHPYPSDNPLLTIEEESYLAYVGKAFELAGRIPLCNAVRHLRRLTCFMEEDVRHLLSDGYLDPTYYYDGHGNRRAITWKFSDPADL
ncbi:hypothetical protein EYR40_003433 [Pleurotus pulmonarius]|nr:hypothetical protein EYR40_003433 [Pleurotus pulmonarius]KAF4606159.1 hypothetical protein EYR38_000205 [Pleurotus pulmonarius]